MAALGSLVVSLAMDTAKFTGDVGKAAQQMARLTAEAGKIGAAIGASIGAGIGIIGNLVKQSIDAADATSKLAVSVGATTEEVSRLAYAADLAGVSQEDLGTSMSKLARFAADAAAGGKTANDVFDAMGIKVKNTDGTLKDTTAILGDITDEFASYSDGAAKTALAQELFGKSGAKLIPLLNQGRDGMTELAKEADMLGITLTTQAGVAAEQFNDNLTRLQKAKEGLGRQIAQALLPALESLTNMLFASAKQSDAFGKAAAIAASGVKLLMSAGALIVGVFDTLGTSLGGVAAALVALFSGRFKDAWNIASNTVGDFTANVTSYARTVNTIWDATASNVQSKAPALGGKLAAPIVLAAEKAAKAGKAIKSEADKVYEAIEKRLGALQFDVDTQGASERIKGLIELTRQGATQEQVDRFLKLTEAQESFRLNAEKLAETERIKQDIMREGAAVFESTRTPAEVLARELDNLNYLLQQGAINWDTYARAVFASQDKFDETKKGAEKTQDAVSSFVEKARQNIQDSLGDTFFEAMNGNFKGIGDAFVKMLQRMVAEALAAKLAQALFGAPQQGGTGGGGIFGSLLSSIGSTLFGGKAYGGPVSAGRAVPVGEHGPEVFVPATAGTVVPMDGMGRTMNLTVNVQATPGMSRQTALQQGQQIGQGIQLAMVRNG